jgi:hypothetical protein
MWCNPANGRVDFEEWPAYKIQLHGIEWIESLSADWDQSPTKKKKKKTDYGKSQKNMSKIEGLVIFHEKIMFNILQMRLIPRKRYLL